MKNSRICVDFGNYISSIYCHNGKLKKIRKKLKKHYTNIEKIEELLNIGNIRKLKKSISKTKNCVEIWGHYKIFYKEDDYCLEEFVQSFFDNNIFYIWKNDEWFYTYLNEPLNPL